MTRLKYHGWLTLMTAIVPRVHFYHPYYWTGGSLCTAHLLGECHNARQPAL